MKVSFPRAIGALARFFKLIMNPSIIKIWVVLLLLSMGLYYPQVRSYRADQKLEHSRLNALEILQSNPNDVAANYQMGAIALNQRNPAKALPFFEKVHSLRPTDIPPLTKILECQLLLKRRSEVQLTILRLRELLKPEDPRLFEVASLLASHDDYSSAIPIMEQIRGKFPDSYDINYNLTLACFQAKQYEKASQAAQPLIQQHPRAEVYNLFAMIEEGRKHYLKAVQAFQKAAELDPRNEGFRFDYGFELLTHQTNPAAIAIFSSGVSDFPNSVRMRLGLGSAYYFAGRLEEASTAWLEAIRFDAKNKFIYFFLGKLYESASDSQTAIENALRSYLKTDPIDPWAFYHYGNILYNHARGTPQPQFQQAKNNLNRALSLSPHLAEAHLQLGIILQEEGHPEESIPRLRKALECNPMLAMAHFRLGQAYKRLGDKGKALAEFDLFEKLNAQGQTDQARQEVMQFLVELKK